MLQTAFNKLVFDIGMHKGEDTRYYLKRGYNVLAIEANPLLVAQNKIKFSNEIATGQLTILNMGIADKEAVLPFYRNLRLSEWSSFDKPSGTRNNTPFEVLEIPCVTTKSLFEEYGLPFYMKVDIEGFDYYCLLDIPTIGDKPKYVSCEAVYLEWLDILKDKGYTKFKLIHQGYNYGQVNLALEKKWWFPKFQIIKNGLKLRLQRFIPFKHHYGSSGPLGNETAGNWKTYDEVKDMYLAYFSYEKKVPLNNVSWFDFHASF